jgi:FAD synthetase
VEEVIEEARRYLSDSRYYLGKAAYLTALAAASYAEGLLDSLRILGLIEFEWPRGGIDEP